VEGMKLARVWAKDNITVDLQGIGLGKLDFLQKMYRWQEIFFLNLWVKFRLL
jgi:hypothetical protein